MDALRPDFLSCYNSQETTSPNIDYFCKDATKFENAYSTTSWTKPAASSLLSGMYPREIGTMHQLDTFPDLEWTLPSELSAAGYETHCVSSNVFVSDQFGFDDFDTIDVLQYDHSLHGRRKSLKLPDVQEQEVFKVADIDNMIVPLSSDINDSVIDMVGDNEDEFFLLWSIDTHGPYFVRGDTSWYGNEQTDFIFEKDVDKSNIQHVRDLYRDMIRYNDQQFGEFISFLRDENLYEDSLIIILSDHGESFGDHRKFPGYPIFGHTDIVYEECVRVPLIIKYPSDIKTEQVIEEPVQITDIYPTILDVLDLPTRSDYLSGRSLYESDLEDERPIFIETQITPSSIYSGAIRRGRYKYIDVQKPLVTADSFTRFTRSLARRLWDSRERLYNLEWDPQEKTNLSRSQRAICNSLGDLFNEKQNSLSKNNPYWQGDELEISAEQEEHLRLLGYRN